MKDNKKKDLKKRGLRDAGKTLGKTRRLISLQRSCTLYRVRQITFFLKCYKKTTEYFLKFLFLFESTILPVNKGK